MNEIVCWLLVFTNCWWLVPTTRRDEKHLSTIMIFLASQSSHENIIGSIRLKYVMTKKQALMLYLSEDSDFKIDSSNWGSTLVQTVEHQWRLIDLARRESAYPLTSSTWLYYRTNVIKCDDATVHQNCNHETAGTIHFIPKNAWSKPQKTVDFLD